MKHLFIKDIFRDWGEEVMMPLIGYIRVSSDKQADAGMSLEVQESQIIKYAELYDIELSEIIVDAGESAKSLRRPGMLRLIELMDRNLCQGVLIVKLDRLTRSVKDVGFNEEGFAQCCDSVYPTHSSIGMNSAMGRM